MGSPGGANEWSGGGGPELLFEVCPSIDILLNINSIKVSILTIWGRICPTKVLIFYQQLLKSFIFIKPFLFHFIVLLFIKYK